MIDSLTLLQEYVSQYKVNLIIAMKGTSFNYTYIRVDKLKAITLSKHTLISKHVKTNMHAPQHHHNYYTH